ncbi:MAG: hypothetical protein Q9208_001440 [Pyrenodesmia sp. 3 TL-2023]
MATTDIDRVDTIVTDISFQLRNLNQLATEPDSVLKRTATGLHVAELSTQLDGIIEELRTLKSTIESELRSSQSVFESEKSAFEVTKKSHEGWYEEQRETFTKAQAKLTEDTAALKIGREELERAKAAHETRATDVANQQRELDRRDGALRARSIQADKDIAAHRAAQDVAKQEELRLREAKVTARETTLSQQEERLKELYDSVSRASSLGPPIQSSLTEALENANAQLAERKTARERELEDRVKDLEARASESSAQAHLDAARSIETTLNKDLQARLDKATKREEEIARRTEELSRERSAFEAAKLEEPKTAPTDQAKLDHLIELVGQLKVGTTNRADESQTERTKVSVTLEQTR